MEDIRQSVVLITGATNGIGKSTGEALAGLGATVIIHGRDQNKINRVVNEIKGRTGSKKVEGIRGDLTSLKEVKGIAAEFRERFDRLDVLINNAGGVFMDERSSKDGIEITFAVNYLSHFLLTNLLLDLLKKSSPSRIIHVSSNAHRFLKKIDLSKVVEVSAYKGFYAYSASKICVNLFSVELAERVKGLGINSNSLHPGVVRTGFGLNSKNQIFRAMMRIFGAFITAPEQGADTSVYLAYSSDVKEITGKYFYKRKPVKTAENSNDRITGRKLWDLSEKLVGDYL